MRETQTRNRDHSELRDRQRPVRIDGDGFVEDVQYRAIPQALPESLKAILVVAYHLPLPKQEVLSLHCDHVDLREKCLILQGRAKKGGKQDTAPIYGDMFAWLDMQLARCQAVSPNGQRLFLDDDGNPITDLRKPWKSACQLAGLPSLMFRDLRRTATRNMIQSGFSKQTVMEAAGLMTAGLLWRCTTTEKKDIIAAGRLMQKYFDEQRLLEPERPSQIKPN